MTFYFNLHPFWLYGVVEPLTLWQWTKEYSKHKARELSGIPQPAFRAVGVNGGSDAVGQSTGSEARKPLSGRRTSWEHPTLADILLLAEYRGRLKPPA